MAPRPLAWAPAHAAHPGPPLIPIALQRGPCEIVTGSETSGRAALAAASLLDMGYVHVQSIAGGFDAWAAAGKPVNKPATPAFG